MNQSAHSRNLTIVTALWVAGIIVSGWRATDRVTWLMEVFPCFVALAFMWPTRKLLPLTPLLYALIGAIVALLLLTRWHDRLMCHMPLKR
jgi:putative membrane protein